MRAAIFLPRAEASLYKRESVIGANERQPSMLLQSQIPPRGDELPARHSFTFINRSQTWCHKEILNIQVLEGCRGPQTRARR